MGMSTDEYEQQKSRRFAILSFDDADALGVAEAKGGGFGYCICDMSSTPPRFLGHDQCEPEDALLVRDFAWVANALNEIAQECWLPELGDRVRFAHGEGKLTGLTIEVNKSARIQWDDDGSIWRCVPGELELAE